MKSSIQAKLDHMAERYEELALLLSDPEIIQNQITFTEYSKEYAKLEPIVLKYRAFCEALQTIEDAKLMAQEDDPDMREMAKEEKKEAEETRDELVEELNIMLLPQDPDDHANVYLEVRAGTGGDEASIFAGDLHRMYLRYAESQNWHVEVMSASEGEHGGYKEVISRITGDNVYSQLKFESGAHRVQRVPVTESQGRVHTSACTVAILPEKEGVEEVDINPSDLRIDTFRASGAGGQHVNKTDSAIRITHIPTGVVVECQEERSQHKNRAKAMSYLSAKLLSAEQEKQQKEQADERRILVGSGDRSERIRTYNYPQGRVTDHRINLTLYQLDDIMEGNLEPVIHPLIQEQQAKLLTSLNDD